MHIYITLQITFFNNVNKISIYLYVAKNLNLEKYGESHESEICKTCRSPKLGLKPVNIFKGKA